MAGVDNKEQEVNMLVELNGTGREVLKQTINVLQAVGSVELTIDDLSETVSQKMKHWKYKFEKIKPIATDEQRDIINYYERLQVLMNKAYKKYLENSKDFDRISLKVANLMEEILSLESQAGLRRLKSKIAIVYSKFNELPKEYKEYSYAIKNELTITSKIVDELINEEQEINEKDKIEKYYKAMITTGLMLSFAVEFASKVEAIVKIFEVICKRYRLRNKIEDITLHMTSFDEVISRKDDFLEIINKTIFDNNESLDYLRKELEINIDKGISSKAFNKTLEAYTLRKEKMYRNYKSLNRIAKDRIDRYLDEEAKSWGDIYSEPDIEKELIDDIITLYETEVEVL